MKTIGIIGGAGPKAGSLLFDTIISRYQARGSVYDKDFPRIILYSYPFDQMLTSSQWESRHDNLIDQLQESITAVEHCGAQVVAIANTLHTLIPYVHFNSQFIDMVSTTLHTLDECAIARPLVLGTETTMRQDLYSSSSIDIVYPSKEQQQEVMGCITRILQNRLLVDDVYMLESIIYEKFQKDGSGGVILGCTELSLLYQKFSLTSPVPVFDPITIVADAIVENS
jgi:aspartate racemase